MSTFLGWDASLVQGYVPVYAQAGWKETLWEPASCARINTMLPVLARSRTTPLHFVTRLHSYLTCMYLILLEKVPNSTNYKLGNFLNISSNCSLLHQGFSVKQWKSISSLQACRCKPGCRYNHAIRTKAARTWPNCVSYLIVQLINMLPYYILYHDIENIANQNIRKPLYIWRYCTQRSHRALHKLRGPLCFLLKYNIVIQQSVSWYAVLECLNCHFCSVGIHTCPEARSCLY